ncbi:hypothetical protein PGTUg99_037730 [Puccinia graminis f. sp. tritici]|uniref:Uncharacterized protein n=1 Tax=Puccinia graminis f. sp. tritici TaxID=56615 RepID=A0A5B0R9V3_PUCGR|nr:hypothetical protein PGTUg99_037730 [Puccinia graminis f. sp. tritici]
MIASSFSYYASISFNFVTGSQESFLFSDKTRNPPAKDVFKRNPANGNVAP